MSGKKTILKSKKRSDEDDIPAPVAIKSAPIVDIDDPVSTLPLEEKVVDDPLAPDSEEAEEAEDETLAEEEINPFGDKWEE